MKKQKCLGIMIVALSLTLTISAKEYKIGVLAKRGAAKALAKWQATALFLNSKIPEDKFVIVPLKFVDVNPSVEAGKVDFFLVNSSMYITAKVKYGAKSIATMINSRQGKPLKSFGGVIITSSENDSINSIADIKGKTFMGVKESSFGGYQMALKEMIDAGVDPAKDCSKLTFGGKHDNVALSVMNEIVDCGTVRTDTLERMEADGTIDLEDFKIINKKSNKDFPFVYSTTLYPEWPLAKVKATPDEIVKKVVEALKTIKQDDPVAKAAKIIGWVEPLDYTPVEDLQKQLGIGGYAK